MAEAKKKERPSEIRVLCCQKCEKTSFLLAEDHKILCAKCLDYVAARWFDKKDIN